MKTLKLVIGILCIVLFAFITFQSCAAGLGNALSENGESSGSAGLFVAIAMLAGGIVMLATRASEKKGGSIACIIIFAIAAIIGFTGAGSYSDLIIWSVLCLIIVAINIVALFTVGKKKPSVEEKVETKQE